MLAAVWGVAHVNRRQSVSWGWDCDIVVLESHKGRSYLVNEHGKLGLHDGVPRTARFSSATGIAFALARNRQAIGACLPMA